MNIIIEHGSGYKLNKEEKLVVDTLLTQEIPFTIASLSQVQRKRIDTTNAYLVVGSIPFMKAAFLHNNIVYRDNCYPAELKAFLNRSIKNSTVKDAKRYVETKGEIFIKPSSRTKRFTGFVLSEPHDFRLSGIPLNENIWMSEPVEWLSEWRFYVINHEIAYCSYCCGNQHLKPKLEIVKKAIEIISMQNQSPCSYAIDFGVMNGDITSLIELNDGFSIGAYNNIPGELYVKLLTTRWQQLISPQFKLKLR